MPLGQEPQCSACKIGSSLMWRKAPNGDLLCNSCHLKRVNSSLRTQRQSSRESKKLIARIKAGSRKGHGNGKAGERTRDRSRRTLMKLRRKPYKSPVGLPTTVASDRIYHKGVLYQVGDVVSVEDIEGTVYFAQVRGFLQDQYAERSAVITWLIPTVPNPENFDPVLFVPGPEEDTPRPMDCLEFVCRAPSELFQAKRDHPPFVIPRKPDLNDLTSAAVILLDLRSTSTSS